MVQSPGPQTETRTLPAATVAGTPSPEAETVSLPPSDVGASQGGNIPAIPMSIGEAAIADGTPTAESRVPGRPQTVRAFLGRIADAAGALGETSQHPQVKVGVHGLMRLIETSRELAERLAGTRKNYKNDRVLPKPDDVANNRKLLRSTTDNALDALVGADAARKAFLESYQRRRRARGGATSASEPQQ